MKVRGVCGVFAIVLSVFIPLIGAADSLGVPQITLTKNYVLDCFEDLSLTAQVSGEGPITLQWYRQGKKLPDETNLTLNYPDVDATGTGEWMLTASNIHGTSSAAVKANDG